MAEMEYLHKIENCSEEELLVLEAKEVELFKNQEADTEMKCVLKKVLQGTIQPKYDSVRALRSVTKILVAGHQEDIKAIATKQAEATVLSSLNLQKQILEELNYGTSLRDESGTIGKERENTILKTPSIKKELVEKSEANAGQSALELLPKELQLMIFEMVGTRSLKALRLTSRTLRQRVEEGNRLWRHWKVSSHQVSRLSRFSEEVEIIEDLSIEWSSCHLYSETNEQDFFQAMVLLLENHEEIRSLPLKFYDFREVEILNDIIRSTGHLLKSLLLRDCRLPETVKDSLPYLEKLELIECRVSDLKLHSILTAAEETIVELNLKSLYQGARYDRITGDWFVDSCRSMKKLKSLKLSEIYLTGRQLYELLSGKPNLCSIKFDRLSLSGEGVPESFKSLERLTSLELESCNNLTDRGLDEIISIMPNLESLVISGSEISGEISNTCKPLTRISKLQVAWCDSLSDSGLSKLLSIMPHLQTLKLKELPKISCEGVERFCKCLPELAKIDFQLCESVTDEGLAELLSIALNLESLKILLLNISGERVANTSCNPMQRLRKLALQDCENLYESGVRNMLSICPKLEKLELSLDLDISEKYLSDLRSQGMDMQICGESLMAYQLRLEEQDSD